MNDLNKQHSLNKTGAFSYRSILTFILTVSLLLGSTPLSHVAFAEDTNSNAGYSDVKVTTPTGTDATYTLRFALTREVYNSYYDYNEGTSLSTSEDYLVTIVYADGTVEDSHATEFAQASWDTLAGQVSGVPSGAHNVLVTTNTGAWDDYVATNLYCEINSSDTSENVVLQTASQALVVGETVSFSVQTEAVEGPFSTDDTFLNRTEPYSGDNGEYSLLYMLNSYNVVSYKDIEATHIVGPILAQEGAYRTDGGVLYASDYSRGVSSYVGKIYTADTAGTAASFQLNYGFDTEDAGFVEPHFYTRETELDGDGFISVTEVVENSAPYQYIHLSRTGSTFRSPNAWGTIDNYDGTTLLDEKTHTYQNDDFIDFDALWDALTADSYALLENGTLEGETEVITIADAGTYLEIEAGRSYLIQDATKLATVNITLPEDYDFFVNPYLPPTTINFEGATINPSICDGLAVSQFPETLINGSVLAAEQGNGGEYSEVGNKIIWNLPNVVTSGNQNRLVTAANGPNIAGHIVAVNAEFWNIDATGGWEGGNLNGTGIFKDYHSGNMEMHMWAYGGLSEQATYITLKVEKTFEHGDLSEHNFQFELTPADDATAAALSDDYSFPLYASTNGDGNAFFDALVFDESGVYQFYAKETIPQEQDGYIIYDQSEYLVYFKVDITYTVEDNDFISIRYTNDYSYTKVVDADGTPLEEGEAASGLLFVNQQQVPETVSYSFTKVDALAQPLAGATFVLTETNPTADASAWDNATSYTSDVDGLIAFENLLPDTTYFFMESVAPVGYLLPNGYWILEVDAYGVITVTSMDGAPSITDKQLPNTPEGIPLGTVTLTKANEHGRVLSDAVFMVERVFSLDSHIVVEGGYATQFTSDENGQLLIADLPLDGVYRITETQAPAGYMLPFDVDYWLVELLSDETAEAGYTVTLYSVDTDGNTTNTTPLDNDFTLINWNVYVLPTTGGIGTLSYVGFGLLLMSCAGVYCLLNSKKEGRRQA